MTKTDLTQHTTLGRTGLRVSRIGLASAYGVPHRAVIRAVEEYNLNYLYWDRRKPGMKEALLELLPRRRDDLVIALQTYDHSGLTIRRSVEKSLRILGIDRVDVLFLGWFNKMPGRRVLDASRRLVEEGKVSHLGLTGHNRALHGELAHSEDGPIDVLQVRYNAAHRGAETEVFADLPPNRPGITTYTATRWGKLLKAGKMPPGEQPLTAADCYRFVLSHPAVDLCLAGPRSERELLEGLAALEQGPMSAEELARARAIGDFVHG